MALCAQCGNSTYDGSNLCPYHPTWLGEDWHKGNKVMCDFFHRGVVPERVKEEDEVVYAEG